MYRRYKLFSLKNISIVIMILTVLTWIILLMMMKQANAGPIITNDKVSHYQYDLNTYQKVNSKMIQSLVHNEQEIVKKWRPEILQEQRSFFSKNTALKPSLRQPILFFISFSLPDKLLKQYQLEASRLGIPLVLRGLYHHSFTDTAKKLYMILRQHNQGGIIINPILFASYHINKVPALVVRKENHFDVIYGNLSIMGLLNIIKVHDAEMTDVIKTILGDII